MTDAAVDPRPTVGPWRNIDSLGQALPSLRQLLADCARERPEDLRSRAEDLRALAQADPGKGLSLEGCALAAAAVARMRGVELHDEQLMAGLALSAGCAVQLRTGEGKTFAAVGPTLVHALSGSKVHVVSANAYLAERDSAWVGDVLRALGCSVGVTLPTGTRGEKRRAYQAEVTYGSAQDFGFDFLRDHLYLAGEEPVQAGLDVALVDEADAVLLDLARTPLILSGAAPASGPALVRADRVVRQLEEEDLEIDRARSRVELSDTGIARCEALLGVDNLFEAPDLDWPQHLRLALRAHCLLVRDHDYVVNTEGIAVVDELTGRVIPGRRWSEGLHQAVEVKEGLAPSRQRRAAGRITVGGYFSSYRLLAGMSGTLEGAEEELARIYDMDTVVLPTHAPVRRIDHSDAVFADDAERYEALTADIASRHQRGQPALAGTTSIGQSEVLSSYLSSAGIPNRVLSARNDYEEAEIIAQAGVKGAVTVATQMAGRGVDIVLGGAPLDEQKRAEVCGLGGLMVWGVEHHPSRRLDMQLRGRSGRQGDPGESRFAVCPADPLVELAPLERPVEDAVGAVETGQRRAESLDAQLRHRTRGYETVIGRLHQHLYDWRLQSQHTAVVLDRLPEAMERVAREFGRQPLAIAGLADPGRILRRRAAGRRLREILQARRAEFGPGLFDEVAVLLLRHLLVAVWPDTLDVLDAMGSLDASIPGSMPGSPRWLALAVRCYRDFERRVEIAWIEQLAGFTVTHSSGPSSIPAAEVDFPAVFAALPANDQASKLPQKDWTGPSFNKFVRRHWGFDLPDPPVVLVVEAISDTVTTQGLVLKVDLDEPSRTTVDVSLPGTDE